MKQIKETALVLAYITVGLLTAYGTISLSEDIQKAYQTRESIVRH